MLIVRLILLLLGSVWVSAEIFESRIIGGSNAKPGDYPFVAQIQVNGQHWCGGFIYNSEWIVTTAACVIGYRHQPAALLVVVGQTDPDATDPTEQSISVSAVHIHNDYDQYTRYNDIAMLQLSKDAILGYYVNAITYGNLDSSINEALGIGWVDGSTGELGNLKQTTVPIRSNDSCSVVYDLQWDPDRMICAGNAINDACNQGDAGTPLVQGTSLEGYRVVGLVSHTIGCGDPLYPTAYTRLSTYSTWMEDKGGSQLITTSDPIQASTTTKSVFVSTTQSVPPEVHQCTTASNVTQFPFIVSILSSTTLDHLCAGFIYNDKFVVTTASCVIRKTGAMLNVTVGQFRFDRPETAEKTYPVTAITLHPQYRESNQTNNIAIVEISGSLTFGEAVQHIYYDSVNYGNPCSVTGWASNVENCVRSLSLLWDDSEIIQTNADCSQSQISTFDAPTMLCTAKVSDGNCEFESGAPLIQGNPRVVVGIKSLFQGCSASSHVVYTRISYYFNWIFSIAGYQPLSKIFEI